MKWLLSQKKKERELISKDKMIGYINLIISHTININRMFNDYTCIFIN